MGEAGILQGGCGCGFVRYRMTSAPIFVNCCHCRECQKSSGSAFAINAMIEADRVVLTGEGEPEIVPTPGDSADGQASARCPRCGTFLWGTHRLFGAPIRFVYVGTLDTGEALVPDAHFFTRSKHRWIALPPEATAFDTLPVEGDGALWGPEAKSRLAAALVA